VPIHVALLYGYLALLALERVAELVVSGRHLRALIAAGGVEHGRGHFAVMVVLHLGFLAACLVEPRLAPRAWPLPASLVAVGVAFLALGLRWWAVASLGDRWTTRVVVLPGAPLVTDGPYRWLRHPNYFAVAAELLAVPLIGGAWVTALVATVLNALLLLLVRIPVEERALGPIWHEAFRTRWPRGGRR
jgi:methyltransferase